MDIQGGSNEWFHFEESEVAVVGRWLLLRVAILGGSSELRFYFGESEKWLIGW